jgi:hypothetical protein
MEQQTLKNDLFDSDDEDHIAYNPEEEGSPKDYTEENKQYNSYSDFNAAADETQEVKEEDTEHDNKHGDNSSDDDFDYSENKKNQYVFNYDCPYPDVEKEETAFSVSNPVKQGYVSYTVRGHDKEGVFEGSRRYKDFHHLRTYLVARWPGVYVPSIPPKQSVGNKKDKFVENRMYFLDRFLKKIGEIPHLINSKEFQIFARPSGEIDKQLAALQQMTPQLLKERLEEELDISPGLDEFLVKQSREAVNDFGAFLKRIVTTLKTIKDHTEKMVNVKEVNNNKTKVCVDVMSYYESNGLSKYTEQNTAKMIVENPDDPELKNKSEGMT